MHSAALLCLLAVFAAASADIGERAKEWNIPKILRAGDGSFAWWEDMKRRAVDFRLRSRVEVGQYYVPRAYYTIDPEGHASYPVPLRRLRRSLPIPYGYGSSSNANANAVSNGFGVSSANANARSESGSGAWAPGAGWVQPGDTYMHPSLGYYNY